MEPMWVWQNEDTGWFRFSVDTEKKEAFHLHTQAKDMGETVLEKKLDQEPNVPKLKHSTNAYTE